jgi:hypothetical protein
MYGDPPSKKLRIDYGGAAVSDRCLALLRLPGRQARTPARGAYQTRVQQWSADERRSRMESQDNPVPLGWYTPASHQDFWDTGRITTYVLISYRDLPPLNRSAHDGSFAWLPALPAGDYALAFEDCSPSPADKLRRLEQEVARARLWLPEGFVRFISQPELHRRVPTCTSCYLELPDRVAAAPGNPDGRLLRFMHDQQCCLLWYLYLRPARDPAVIVVTPEFDEEGADGDTPEDVMRLRDPRICAPTFEDFIHRFWIENAIWYALTEQRSLTPEQAAYVDHVRRLKMRRTTPSSS